MALRYSFRQLLQKWKFLSLQVPSKHGRLLHCWSSTVFIKQQPQIASTGFLPIRSYSQAQTQDSDSVLTATEKIRNLSPEMKYSLELIKMQHATALSQCRSVLENPTDSDWLYVLQHCRSDHERLKHLMFLQLKNVQKAKAKLNKRPSADKTTHLELSYDAIMLRVIESQTALFWNNNLMYAMQHGPHVVLDMAFCATQPMRAVKRVFIQLAMMIGANRRSRQPFHLHLCGVDDSISDELYRLVLGLANMPVTVSNESYLEHYPNERLVYLSPDAPKTLTKYSANDVYIIGGIVDLAGGKFSYPKAKQEGIRSAKLPLQNYVVWKQGGKSLTLDQVFKILLTAAETDSNWEAAFTHLPRRKIGEKQEVHRIVK